MIEKIRQYSETWWFKTFLGIIALVFVLLWGGGDILNQMTGTRQTVATVGDTRLTSWELERALRRELTHLSRRMGRQITRQEALEKGLYQATLSKLIEETLVEKEALRLGVLVSDQAVRTFITTTPLFQTQDGAFSKEHFLHLLSQLGYTEASFVEEVRRDMVRTRLFTALFKGLLFPAEQAKYLYQWQEQTRQVTYVVVDSTTITLKEQPTPSKLEKFFKVHGSSLRVPERRDVTVLLIDPDKIASSLTVTEDELRQAFEERASDFAGKKFSETRSTLEKDLKKAAALEKAYTLSTQVEDALAGGATLSEAAKQFSLATKTFKGLDETGRPDRFQTREGRVTEPTSLAKAVAAEAFLLDPGVVGSAVEVTKGLFFVAEVKKVSPARERTLKDVHPQYARKLWRQALQKEKVAQIVDELQKKGQSRSQLVVEASKKGLRLRSVKVTRKGAAVPSSLVIPPKLVATLFKTPKGKSVAGPLEEAGDKHVAFVGLVDAIHYPNEKKDPETFQKLIHRLSDLQKEDLAEAYIASLRKRFTVNINQRFMKSLSKKP